MVEGTLDMQPTQDDGPWFEIGRVERPMSAPETGSVPFVFESPVQWVRLRVRADAGFVREIQYRN